jgi:signal transduction histidine kinase/ActR/RegA family two-component response regulator
MREEATSGTVAALTAPDVAESPLQLQACLRDLVTLNSLPALWTGQDCLGMVGVFLEVVAEVLHAEIAYVRVVRADGVVEQARARRPEHGDALQAARALQAAVREVPFTTAVSVKVGGSAGNLRAMRFPLGTTGQMGEVFIACRRSQFATPTERLLGRVAVNQLQVGLTQAQLSAERKRDADRLALLARAGESLASTLDYETTLRNVVSVALPDLGDFGFFDITETGDSVRRIARAHACPEQQALLDASRWVRFGAAEPDLCALSSGRASLHPTIDEGWSQQSSAAPEYLALVRSLSVRSMLSVPLLYEGRLLGALSLFFAGPGSRRHTSDDLLLAEELARRAAAAVENARLYRELQRAVRHKEDAERRKDEFLAMLGHELRNPLSPIMTALQLMRLRGAKQYDRERVIIERQVRHLERLVDDLLDLSRVTQGKLELRRERVELGEVVAQAIELSSPLLEQKRQRLNVEVERQGLLVDVDRVRLAQVITNLLTNACKYTPEQRDISVSAQACGGTILLRVRDQGEGIAPELLPHVFDMFVQAPQTLARSHGGLGLGLTIARRLVELHGGSISAMSQGLGKGSQFEMRLPALKPTEQVTASAPEERAPAPASGSGCRVLVVDDNRDAVDLLAEAISMLGYDVRVAYDGAAALEAVVQFRPEVVLLDIGLPIVDGYEVARRVRQLPGGAEVKLVAVTGYGQESDKSLADAAGFDRHLVKPIDLEKLFAMLRSMSAQDTSTPNTSAQ